MSINLIQGMQSALSQTTESPLAGTQEKAEASGFSSYLKNSFEEVNRTLASADKLANDLAVGKHENLHEAMIGMEKAEASFKLLVQVRNRALEAYNDIMRMQV